MVSGLTGKSGRRDNLGAEACEGNPNIWCDVPTMRRLATCCLCNLHKEDYNTSDDRWKADLGEYETILWERSLASLGFASHSTSMDEFAQSAADLFSQDLAGVRSCRQ